MDLSSLLIGLLIGGVAGVPLGGWLLRGRLTAQHQASLAEAQARLQAELAATEAGRARADQLARDTQQRLDALTIDSQRRIDTLNTESQGKLEALHASLTQLQVEAEALRQRLQNEQRQAADKQAFFDKAHETLSGQFKSLAGDILELNSKRFAEQNQQNIGRILEPLRERLGEFQQKVETLYVDESKERSALKAQVQDLVRLNQSLSEDTRNLTSALRGSAKRLGNWGELILERVLEASGLRKDHEYVVQDSQSDEDGQRRQPDVVIHLPEERRLVVDSKLSLLAYERFMSADDEVLREAALRDHLTAVRTHIRQLSDKRYQRLYGESLDFVIMFVPIEPAFMTAVSHDEQIFMDAWESNVLMVSPSTLLFVVRTVAHLWRQEAQSRNAQEIAKRGAELYDRLTGFTQELADIGTRLDSAQNAWRDATRKLATGRGNVIRQAEMLKELGIRPTKALSKDLLGMSEDEDGQGVVGAA